MKNIKGLILGAGVLGSAFVSLGWWCDYCGKDHRWKCPRRSLLGCDSDYNYGCGYDEGYDTEEEKAFLEERNACYRRHHETNLKLGIRGLLSHVHNEQDLQRVQQALDEKSAELRRNAGYGCFNCGGCSCHPFYDCQEDDFDCRYDCNYSVGCGSYGRSGYGCQPWKCSPSYGCGYGCGW
ncbi:MAG: hypothetical protein ACSW8C_00205 [bacterium]